MKRIISVVFLCIFIVSAMAFAEESQDELKKYLNDMNMIAIEVELAMRYLSMKFLSVGDAVVKMSTAIEKFEALSAPPLFSGEHNAMLSAFKSIRDGLKLFSENEREESLELVREGAALLRETATKIRTKAEKEGLIPAKPKPADSAKPILPSQTPSVIAGTSPTSSPRISSPDIESDFMDTKTYASADINLQDIPDSASIPTRVPRLKPSEANVSQSLIWTAVGEIVSIGPSEDYFIVEVDDVSGKRLKIDIKPQYTSVLKDNKIVGINEINTGEPSYIVYTRTNNKNQAILVSILKPEDADALKKSMKFDSLNAATMRKPIP